MLLILGLIIGFPVLARDLQSGLLAYLPLDGSTVDLSGQGRIGQLLGGFYTNGISGDTNAALHLTGDNVQGVSIPDDPSLNASQITVSAWIRTSSKTTIQIANKGKFPTSTGEEWSWYIDNEFFSPGNSVLVLAIKRGSAGVTGNGWFFGYSTPLPRTNDWMMVAGSWNGTNIGLYLNGEPLRTSYYPAKPTVGAIDSVPGGDVNIGRSSFPKYPFVGDMAEFRLYGRPLTPADVKQIFQLQTSYLPGRPAEGIANIFNGFVVSTTLTDGGGNYAYPPQVRFVGGGGSGATARAQVSDGMVTNVIITDAGHGYTNPPTLVIDAPVQILPYRPAIARPVIFNGFIADYEVTDGGVGYTNPPTVVIMGGGGADATATASVSGGRVVSITPTNPGRGYGPLTTVQISSPGPMAAAGLSQVAGGFLVGLTLESGGSGYTASPQVSFIGGGGTGASATAVVSNGVVVGLNITSTGKGYTTPPIVRIDPPSSATLPPSALSITVQSVRVSELVVVGRAYALESSTDLDNWSQIGEPWAATSPTMTVDIDVNGTATYFRLRDVTFTPSF